MMEDKKKKEKKGHSRPWRNETWGRRKRNRIETKVYANV